MATTTTLTPLEQVLNASLSSTDVFDVQLVVFSKQARPQGQRAVRFGESRPIFVASTILRSFGLFDDQSTSTSGVSNGAALPNGRNSYNEGSEYDSDSDIDYDDTAISQVKSACFRGRGESDTNSTEEGSGGKIRQVVIKGAAYRTWQALIFYLYTGKLNFAPLKSSGLRTTKVFENPEDMTSTPMCSPKSMYRLAKEYGLSNLQKLAFNGIQCGVSSFNIVQEVMSKFTSRYDEVLKFEVESLCKNYHEQPVRDAMPRLVNGLVRGELSHSSGLITMLLCRELCPRNCRMCKRNGKKGGLWRQAATSASASADSEAAASLPPSSTNMVTPLTPTEQVLKASLSSLDVFDVKFFLYSKRISAEWTTQVGSLRSVLAAGSVIQGVEYFKSLLSNGFSESAGEAGVDVVAPDHRTSTEDFDYESDSDLEDFEGSSSIAAVDQLQENVTGLSLKETLPPNDAEGEGEDAVQSPLHLTRPIPGDKCRHIFVKDVAYKTWRAFIFYLYTGKYSFAPLRSSGRSTEFSADDLTAIPLCSPKSMYRLAEKYDVPVLRQLALEGIKADITPANVVEELTSKFTSRYDEIRDFELEYLCSNYFSEGVMSAMPGMVAKLANGELPHASDIVTILLTEKVVVRQ